MKPTRDGMIIWAEQEAEKYRTKMEPTREELKLELQNRLPILSDLDAYDAYTLGWKDHERRYPEQDPWRGPDERPEEGSIIAIYYKVLDVSRPFRKAGFYEDLIECWSSVICWHPIDFGPMPERFKKENTK